MPDQVVIFGLDSLAEKMYTLFSKDSRYDVVAFTASEQYIRDTRQDDQFFGLPVIPFEQIQESHPPDRYDIFVAVGYSRMNKARAEICGVCKSKGYRLVTYISPEANCENDLRIGENCLVRERSHIGRSAQIGDGVIIFGSLSTIGRGTVIGDYCYTSSAVVIGDNVRIGPYCFVGMGAVIRDHITVAPECVIGAGAVILHDTVPKGVYKAPEAELLPITSDQLRGI